MKKYCLFEGGDVVGPFSAQELLKRPGFGSHSLVCPDEYSDEESYWKDAGSYEEFGFTSAAETPKEKIETEVTEQTQRFLKEMDSVMTELSSFHVEEKQPVLAQDTTEKESSSKEDTPQPAPAFEAKDTKPEPSVLQGEEEEPAVGKTKNISSILLQASEEMKEKSKASSPATQNEPLAQEQPASQSVGSVQKTEQKTEEKETQPPAEKQPELEVEPVARTISQVSPLEEYFNTMRTGDLGNILGIPDPKENSDMSLSRAIQNQFEKTEPGLAPTSQEEEDPFDAFAPTSKPEEVKEELFEEQTLAQSDQQTQERLMQSLPDLQKASALKVAGQGPSKLEEPVVRPELEIDPEQDPENTEPPTLQEMIVPDQEDDPNDRTVKTILEGTLNVNTQRSEIPEPIKDVPADDAKAPCADKAPAISDDNEEDFLQDRVVRQTGGGKKKIGALVFGVIILLLGVFLNLLEKETPSDVAADTHAEQQQTKPAEKAAVSAREVIGAIHTAQQAQNPLDLAKEIVQQYSLPNGQGTIETYFQQRYQEQLQSGYAAVWSAEPLHKDVYVVKYRLAKTRKEPIVYIFQVDTTKKKLTGALNNITLDLVGKIR